MKKYKIHSIFAKLLAKDLPFTDFNVVSSNDIKKRKFSLSFSLKTARNTQKLVSVTSVVKLKILSS